MNDSTCQGYDPEVIEVGEWIVDCLYDRLQGSPIDILVLGTIISEEISRFSPDVFNSMLFEAKRVTYQK